MKTIVCVDSNWGIGSNNDLLYHIPADMKYFKEKTMGNVVVMGMATVLSLPGAKPLPGRTTVALSDDPDWAPEGVIVCRSIDEMLEKLKEFDTDSVYICGGASVYAQMIDYCDTAYITKVYACDKDAEKFFPDMDKKPGWHIAEESDYMEYNDLVFRFLTYKKDENITADN
ncbi:MAG: dihydrofolate reductase [Clostridia bacterium]|nr:dihydrofolate reductase [Clostridia bacterium]